MSRIGKEGLQLKGVGRSSCWRPSSWLVDLLRPGVDLLRAVQGAEFLAAHAIGFACIGLSAHTDIPALKELEEWFDCSTRRKKFGS